MCSWEGWGTGGPLAHRWRTPIIRFSELGVGSGVRNKQAEGLAHAERTQVVAARVWSRDTSEMNDNEVSRASTGSVEGNAYSAHNSSETVDWPQNRSKPLSSPSAAEKYSQQSSSSVVDVCTPAQTSQGPTVVEVESSSPSAACW